MSERHGRSVRHTPESATRRRGRRDPHHPGGEPHPAERAFSGRVVVAFSRRAIVAFSRRAIVAFSRRAIVAWATAALAVAAFVPIAAVPPAPAHAADGPGIIAYSPPTGTLDVSPDLRPWIKFSEPVDQSTVTDATLYLTVLGSPVKVPVAYEFIGPPQNKVTLAPVAPLSAGATYEATVTTGVKDLAGDPLVAAWTWTFTVNANPPTDEFVDVPPGSAYYDAIQGLYEAHVVDGTPGSLGPEFRPQNAIWRQQFAKMIVNVLGLAVDETMKSPFTDLGEDSPTSLYPHQFVAVAWQNAITTGYTPTSFAPYRNITRAQVITMGVRALESLHPGRLTPPTPGYTNTWGTSFSPIHGPLARIAEYNGLLDGLGVDALHPAGDLTALDPWGDMPRGEVAQFLWNVYVMLQSAAP